MHSRAIASKPPRYGNCTVLKLFYDLPHTNTAAFQFDRRCTILAIEPEEVAHRLSINTI